MSNESLITALNQLASNNILTRAGEHWSADNAQFEATNPSILSRIGRSVNPLTGFGSALGATQDAARKGDPWDILLAGVQAMPTYGVIKNIPIAASGASKTIGSMKISDWLNFAKNLGVDTTKSVGIDEVQAKRM